MPSNSVAEFLQNVKSYLSLPYITCSILTDCKIKSQHIHTVSEQASLFLTLHSTCNKSLRS